jgi:hypothetical protein
MVTERFLYQHLVIRSPARANAILETLLASRRTLQNGELDIGYGRWPIHIEIFTHARGTNNIRFLQTLFRIFQCCPNVRHLSGSWVHPLPIEFLNVISEFYAPSLQGLCWDETCTTASFTTTTPDFLSSFNVLRTLDLRHYVGCNLAPFSESPILPHVTDLILSTCPESLQIASFLSLPQVRNLTLCISLRDCQVFKPRVPYPEIRKLIEKHGHTLISVDLPTPAPILEPEPDSSVFRHTVEHIKPEVFLESDACPNLVSFVYPVTSEPLPPHVHPNLRRIGLRGILRTETLYPDKRSRVKAHLERITPELYPRLQEVRTVGFLVDAETDRYIKDVFIWWVEKFEDHGIDFLDGEGVLWTYTDPVDKDIGPAGVPSKLGVDAQPKEPCATPLDTPTELMNTSERLACV